MQIEITLPGRPITKKNSQVVVKARTREGKIYHRPIPSQAYQAYEEECLWRLKTYRGPRFKETPCNLQAIYWMPDRRSWPDLLGLLQSTADILEEAKIIDNDKHFVSFDGSRIAGVDKHNPRVSITITEVENDDKRVS